jgi:hypothetical protein
MITYIIILFLFSLGVYLIVSQSGEYQDYVNRVMSGQWFVVGAERRGDLLEVSVTAKSDETSVNSKEIELEPEPISQLPKPQPGMENGGEYTYDISGVADMKLNTNPMDVGPPYEIVKEPEVFIVQDNIYSYDDAEPLCRAYGSRLATMGDLYNAWKKGANWCIYGWVKGRKAVYPIQKKEWLSLQNNPDETARNKCGLPGINGGFVKDSSARYGVHCYGVKPPLWKNYMANKMAQENASSGEILLDERTKYFKRRLNEYTIVPFSKQDWASEYNAGDYRA